MAVSYIVRRNHHFSATVGDARPASQPRPFWIHRTISNALDLAVDRRLIDTNPATQARSSRPDRRSTIPTIWDTSQLAVFLAHTEPNRLYRALHLTSPHLTSPHPPWRTRWASMARPRHNQRDAVERPLDRSPRQIDDFYPQHESPGNVVFPGLSFDGGGRI